MKSWQLLTSFVLMSIFCALENVEAATLQVTIDGQRADVPLRYEFYKDRDGGYYEVDTPSEKWSWETSEGRVEIGTTMDPDPFLIFGSVAFDFGAPSSFGFTFIMPLAPLVSNPSWVSDSFAGSVTNGPAPQVDGGVTVTALPPPAFIPVDNDGITEMQVYTLSDDGGATWQNVGLDAGVTEFVPLAPGGSGATTSYNQGPIPTIAGGPWTHMRADVNFGLSGLGDFFTFNGAKVLVPEPSSFVLVVMTLGGFALRRRSVR